jgi:hypothetical protein
MRKVGEPVVVAVRCVVLVVLLAIVQMPLVARRCQSGAPGMAGAAGISRRAAAEQVLALRKRTP